MGCGLRALHQAPAATGLALAYPHPAGAELVVLAFTVPGKADLYSAPLIAIDLFSLRADHGSHVRAVDSRFCQWGRAPFGPTGDQHGGLLVARALIDASGFLLQAGELAAFMDNRVHPPMRIEVVTWVTCQGEAQARLQANIVTLNLRNTDIMAQRGDAVFGERLAHGIALVAAWVIEVFVLFGLMLREGPSRSVLLAVGRVGKGVVTLNLASGAHLLAVAQAYKAGSGLIATAVGLVQHIVRVYRLAVIVEILVFIFGLDGATC